MRFKTQRSLKNTLAAAALMILAAAALACGDESSSDSASTPDPAPAATPDPAAAPDAVTPEPEATPDPTPDAAEPDAPAPRIEFSEGPYGTGFRETAGPFTLTTDRGEFSFGAETWTGRVSHVFLLYTNDNRQSPDLLNFLEAMWYPGGTATGELTKLIQTSPRNVHYFFVSFDSDAAEDMARMRADIDTVLGSLNALDAGHWGDHLHVVTQGAGTIGGWYGESVRDSPLLWFGIDQDQKKRQLASPYDISTQRPGLSNVAYEAVYFDFEMRRANELSEESFTRIPVFGGESVKNARLYIDLPPASEMAAFDTMLFDKGSYCNENNDANCGEWDYLSHMYICDKPGEEVNPHAEQSCQPRVEAVEEVLEVLGTCLQEASPCREVGECDEGLTCVGFVAAEGDNEEILGTCGDTAAGCATDETCGEGLTCAGYVAPVTAVEEVAADTLPCQCTTPLGETLDAEHVCKGEGTGYRDCSCACNTEIGRWITTYGREGRWVTDASPMLSMFARGGRQLVRMNSGNAYNMKFDILLSNRSKGGGHPNTYLPLFGGGRFNENYNMSRAPVEFEVPEDVTRVQLVALITGHGWGAEVANCAEFCNHTHHFDVNGTEHVKDHPTAGTANGCRNAVVQGVVPNQAGTWPYGRAGWCPGLEVTPYVVDVTENLVDGVNTISYRGLFNGADYVPQPSNSGMGFGANINMTSYLVYWRD